VRVLLLACLVACGAAPHEPVIAATTTGSAAPIDAPHRIDPDLERVPRPPLLAIDWDSVSLGSDKDALALWAQIAPTGSDYEEKLYEVPVGPISKALAVALLRQGNFTCVHQVPGASCGVSYPEVDHPIATAAFTDPCLRRELALWSLDQIEPAELANIRDVLPALVTIPPPESDLVEGVLAKDNDNPDQNARLDLLARAWKAGQRDLAGAKLGSLDEAHLTEALQKDHMDPALDVLSATGQRSVYLAAVNDAHLEPATRAEAITELVEATGPALETDLRGVLLAATKAPDCGVAAAAALALVRYHALGAPKPPATMRTLCVVASYERLQRENETSPLADLIPRPGVELVRVAYDPDAAVGSDGVDPRRTTDLIPTYAATFPEGEDLVRAFGHCKGTTCSSEEHDFRFTIRGGLLTRLEIDERAPCAR
jgi:hypothetical protein